MTLRALARRDWKEDRRKHVLERWQFFKGSREHTEHKSVFYVAAEMRLSESTIYAIMEGRR